MTPRIAVIGDIMVDIDLHCVCERICQEGPWPVLRVERTESRPGGAGNVAAMCRALGCESTLLGFGEPSIKRRFFVDGKLTGPRIDLDQRKVATENDVDQWLRAIRIFTPDAIIVADHGKGVVGESLMRGLSQLAVPILVDPIASTPIIAPVECICGGSREIPAEAPQPEILIEKRGPGGLRWRLDEKWTCVPSTVSNAVDALGAGDQFIAALAWRRCLGDTWAEAITIANSASGIQCQRRGCVPVAPSDLQIGIVAGNTLWNVCAD
ncbi:bifunctional heptose 7-phosphate kinase/heptose 1-phosphate adenyltransferase [Schlesneria sp. T3-172]|uniref:bifunctional heptose 7-phosphate kinase/heptose 1-phosphate adenyltransferase n=1 Tax=Schlesneria sphaerica TaxID=3373610 RepID=UPI0037CA4C75